MEHVIVERTLPEPVDFAELQAREDAASWCLSQNRVRFLHSYFAADRCRMICVYEAPDAEAVRRANETAGLPFDRIWIATAHGRKI